MRLNSIILSLFISLNYLCSQQLSIKDIESGRLTYLKPSTLNKIQWKGLSDTLMYSDDSCLYVIDLNKEGKRTLVDLYQLNAALTKTSIETFGTFPEFSSINESNIGFSSNHTLVVFSLKDHKIQETYKLPKSPDSCCISSEAKRVACTIGANIWLIGPQGENHQITFDSIAGITNGEVPYRNEFGEESGMFWSPNGNYLAFYRLDQSKVTEYPLVDIKSRPATLRNKRYPMAGMQSQQTEVWIYSIKDNRHIKIQTTGAKDSYHTNLSWSPDEKYLVIQDLNRKQDSLEVNSYSITDGKKLKTLFSDTDAQYVEPQFPVWFSEKSPGNFYYLSRRDGYTQLYEYDNKKGESIQLTKGAWEIIEFKGFDADENCFYFIATKDSPLERHLYKCT
jgi:dipeptidyl-peptidase-4